MGGKATKDLRNGARKAFVQEVTVGKDPNVKIGIDRNAMRILGLDSLVFRLPGCEHLLVNDLGDSRFDVHKVSISIGESPYDSMMLGRPVIKGMSTGRLRYSANGNGGWKDIDRRFIIEGGDVMSWSWSERSLLQNVPDEVEGPSLSLDGQDLRQVSVCFDAKRLVDEATSTAENRRMAWNENMNSCFVREPKNHDKFVHIIRNAGLSVREPCTADSLDSCLEASVKAYRGRCVPDVTQFAVGSVGHIAFELLLLLIASEIQYLLALRADHSGPKLASSTPAKLVLSLHAKKRFSKIVSGLLESELEIKLEEGGSAWIS